MQRGKWPLIIAFLAPTLILYGVFMVIPYFASILISFTTWSGFSTNFQFIGLYNYITLFHDPTWWQSLLHNLIYIIMIPIVTLGLALFFASLVTRGRASTIAPKVYGAQLYRILYFLPFIMPATVVGILWQYVYEPNDGLLGGFLGLFSKHAASFPWLGDAHTALLAIGVVGIWQSIGFYMVLFIAGIQGIPSDMYEAAAIDGAKGGNMFLRITIPLLWNQIQVAIVYVGIFAMDMFVLVSVITNSQAGPSYASSVMTFYLWQSAFVFNKFGYASAMGTIVFLLSLALAIVTFRITRRDVIQY
ncbi:MAG: carbohydrate ABC transporter permease [Candidatus Dormibacteraceae bacterium]